MLTALFTLARSTGLPAPLNTWTLGKNIPPEVQRTFGKRLDYIFHRGPTLPERYASLLDSATVASTSATALDPFHPPTLSCIESEVVLDGLVPGQAYSYSDHFGLRAKFAIVRASSNHDASSGERTLFDSTSQAHPASKEEGDQVTPVSSVGSASSSTPLRTLVSLSQTQRTLSTFHTLIRHHRTVHLPHAKSMLYLVPLSVHLLPSSFRSRFISDSLESPFQCAHRSAGSDDVVCLFAERVLFPNLRVRRRAGRVWRLRRAHRRLCVGSLGVGRPAEGRGGGIRGAGQAGQESRRTVSAHARGAETRAPSLRSRPSSR